MQSPHKIINLISGPRNISTALMYSFGNRKDTSVIDEPFYANYLTTHPLRDHPGKGEILASQPHAFGEVLNEILSKSVEAPYLFVKNMAHHLDQLDWSFLTKFDNVFLIREPKRLIASFAQVIPKPTMLDIGLALEWKIFEYLESKGNNPVVLDSSEILKSPKIVLSKLCAHLNMPFDEDMLSWSAGPRKEDGVWAKYWYKNVHKSTGFTQRKLSEHPFPDHLKGLLNEAEGYYNKLKAFTIKAE
ncbi:MAG: sulfotransferase family protein [Saprospiraceae bacterium]|nr:sulfotransferase family protein [Bacteroidia bacterium]NNL92718.1 sulfotransferase family protein [Saprospiraceae bacterium]